jgi:hypothetical protein
LTNLSRVVHFLGSFGSSVVGNARRRDVSNQPNGDQTMISPSDYSIHFTKLRGAMKNFLGPLEIPDLQWQITKAVEDFAEQQLLRHESLYHDQYRWLVSRESKPMRWLVEIAAFTVLHPNKPAEDKLFFIPDAFRIDKTWNQFSLPPPDVVLSNFDFIYLYTLRNPPVDAQKQIDGIYQQLQETWDKVAVRTEEDCTHLLGTVEPEP